MATVHLVSDRADADDVAAALRTAGLDVTIVTPERIETADVELRAEVALLDLRKLDQAALEFLSEEYGEQGAAVVCLVAADQLHRLSEDLAIDDFVVAPPPVDELVLRVNRCLYRKHGIDSENVVRAGNLVIDMASYRVTVSGEQVVLTFKEYELLRFLATNAGQVFTREQLLNRVWGYDYFGGARTVDVHIRRIRSKIEERGDRYIETVRNVGYRLVAGE